MDGDGVGRTAFPPRRQGSLLRGGLRHLPGPSALQDKEQERRQLHRLLRLSSGNQKSPGGPSRAGAGFCQVNHRDHRETGNLRKHSHSIMGWGGRRLRQRGGGKHMRCGGPTVPEGGPALRTWQERLPKRGSGPRARRAGSRATSRPVGATGRRGEETSAQKGTREHILLDPFKPRRNRSLPGREDSKDSVE